MLFFTFNLAKFQDSISHTQNIYKQQYKLIFTSHSFIFLFLQHITLSQQTNIYIVKLTNQYNKAGKKKKTLLMLPYILPSSASFAHFSCIDLPISLISFVLNKYIEHLISAQHRPQGTKAQMLATSQHKETVMLLIIIYKMVIIT